MSYSSEGNQAIQFTADGKDISSMAPTISCLNFVQLLTTFLDAQYPPQTGSNSVHHGKSKFYLKVFTWRVLACDLW